MKNDKYSILLKDIRNGEIFSIIAPSKRDISNVVSLLASDKDYELLLVRPSGKKLESKKFNKFMKQLKGGKGNKPDGLHFGGVNTR